MDHVHWHHPAPAHPPRRKSWHHPSTCKYPPVLKLNMTQLQKKQAFVQLTSTTKSDRRAMELYDCRVIYLAGITNLGINSYSNAILLCLINHPNFPSIFNQLSSSEPVQSASKTRYLKLLAARSQSFKYVSCDHVGQLSCSSQSNVEESCLLSDLCFSITSGISSISRR